MAAGGRARRRFRGLRDELADCLVYLVALSDALDVDVVDDAVTRIRGAVEASTR